MKMFVKILSVGLLAMTLIVPLAVTAQGGPEDPGLGTGVSTIGGVFATLQKAITWIFGILLVLAVIFLLYAAFLYLTSGGEEEKTKKAKNFLLYAIIAIVIAVLSRGIIALVRSFVGS